MEAVVMIDYMSDCHDRSLDPGPQSGSFGNHTESKTHQNCGFSSYHISTNIGKHRLKKELRRFRMANV